MRHGVSCGSGTPGRCARACRRAARRAFASGSAALALAFTVQGGAARAIAAQALPGNEGEGGSAPSLARAIETITERPPLDGVHWGIHVVDAGTGAVLYAKNARKRFVPASNMKIAVSAAALLARGPEWRFTTEIWSVAPVDEAGRVRGNLVIPATGDPTLSARFHDDDEAPLRALVDSLRARGITSVDGALVIDRSAWDTLAVPGSWMVGNIAEGFSAAPATFAIGEGATRVEIRGAEEVGEPAVVRRLGGGTPGFVTGEVVSVARSDTTANEIEFDWRPESGVHRIRGGWHVERVDTLAIATRLAEREAGVRLLQLLDSAGIPVRDGVRLVADTAATVGGGCLAGSVRGCEGAVPLVRLESPTLLEITRALLEPSQNWITEQVMRSLGADAGPLASRVAARDTIVAILAREAGVDTLDLSLRDGSGLSAYNLVTPQALTAILARMLETPWAAGWRDALAAPGEEESTLEHRLGGFEATLQAKTGTISNVNALSGYLDDAAGRTLIFSILTNGSGLPAPVVQRVMDEVVATIARHPPDD
ncbi:MAG: D-alanyl-D-alanine carboxypeptidase/D-alanyl-D-alanine-endopeptidase [Longimicrobiales bacterium]|nr:D-alanyl-D-alanine carboxypeptidase/D-alanyl-D-alanine-endopeptidase [Longimicrobiales bacterium]